MPWYAAHIIMCFKWKEGAQTKFPVHENVFVIQADSEEAAWKKAAALGKGEEGDDSGSLRCDGQPAVRSFAGVRKLTTLMTDGSKDGAEVSYSELLLDSEAAVRDLARGNAVTAVIDEVASAE